MMSTGSTGSLFNIESPAAPPLSVKRAREEAFAMPIHGPVFGRSPSWFLDRPALTVAWTAVCVVYFPARGTESSGGGLTDHPKLIEKFSRGQIGRLERSPKWSHSHAIF
jgi:hypothetical protein